MDFLKLITTRYSVRAYLRQSVEKEKIDYILDCARLAPSACNLQPWHFYVVTEEVTKQQIQVAYDREWFKTAPIYIVVCEDTVESWKRGADNKDFADVDAAIAAEHICLATAAIGLGTCWVCNFNPDILRDALSIPNNMEAIAIFPIGYIDTNKSKETLQKRKSLADITTWK